MIESRYGIENKLIFRETFESQANTTRLGGTATVVSYLNGVATFNNNGYIIYNFPLKGTYSIRVKFKSYTVPPLGKMIVDFRSPSTGTGYINDDPIGTLGVSSGTVYINGVASTVINANTKEFIISGMTINGTKIYFGSDYTTGAKIIADVELFEIYKGTLLEREVKNIYNNSQYGQNMIGLISNVDAFNGYIQDRTGRVISSSGVTVLYGTRIGMLFKNGYIDLGADLFGIGDFTVSAWCESIGTNVLPNIFTNVNAVSFAYYHSVNSFAIRSNGVNSSIIGYSKKGIITNIVFRLGSDSNFSLFYNGTKVSGNLTSRLAGTSNSFIGRGSNAYQYFDYIIYSVKIWNRLLNDEECSREWSSKKSFYGAN